VRLLRQTAIRVDLAAPGLGHRNNEELFPGEKPGLRSSILVNRDLSQPVLVDYAAMLRTVLMAIAARRNGAIAMGPFTRCSSGMPRDPP
jgi:hypothetical protein